MAPDLEDSREISDDEAMRYVCNKLASKADSLYGVELQTIAQVLQFHEVQPFWMN